MTVTGVTRNRARDRNLFSPDADLSKNVWYWYDLPGIAASLPPSVAESAAGPAPSLLRCSCRSSPAVSLARKNSPIRKT
jgi:hypothetical protein